jgi:hypothetical protein
LLRATATEHYLNTFSRGSGRRRRRGAAGKPDDGRHALQPGWIQGSSLVSSKYLAVVDYQVLFGRYVLARHLKRVETVHPMVEIGKFRGEPVYARAAVISLKTAENWMRIGRKVKPGYQPMKWVKSRAATVNKRREIEMALEISRSNGADDDAGEDVMQGLYALSQTELYKPPPVVDVRHLWTTKCVSV